MIHSLRPFLALLLASLAFVARANDTAPCDDAVIEAIAARQGLADLRHPAGEDDAGPGLVVAEDCRVWPHDARIRLAVLAYVRSAAEAPSDERDLVLMVAMLDASDARVLASATDDLPEDAITRIEAGSLRLDTAAYDLAPGVRAFGIGISSVARGPSCPDGMFNDELRLFVRDESALRPVLSVFREDWAQISGSICNDREPSVTEFARVSIGVEKTRTHGYADLRLIAAVERAETPAAPRIDEGRTTTRRETRVLHYDGKRYRPDGYDVLHFWSANE